MGPLLARSSLLLAAFRWPWEDDPYPYVRPTGATSTKYFDLLEQNTHIVYPALAILVLVLMAFGILLSLKSRGMDGVAKAEFKREIILELRRQMGGANVDSLSRSISLEKFKLVRLLEEMERDGIVACHTNTDRRTVWRLKGI